MEKEETNIRDLLKSIIAFIPIDTIRFDIDHELPPHLTEMDSFTQISRWECRKLDMDYTNYTLKFGVMGKKNTEEMNKRSLKSRCLARTYQSYQMVCITPRLVMVRTKVFKRIPPIL